MAEQKFLTGDELKARIDEINRQNSIFDDADLLTPEEYEKLREEEHEWFCLYATETDPTEKALAYAEYDACIKRFQKHNRVANHKALQAMDPKLRKQIEREVADERAFENKFI